MKILLLVVIALSLAIGATIKNGFSNQSDAQDSQNGRFKKLAKEAKEKGKTQVATASFTTTDYGGEMDSLDFLLHNYSFILAEVVEQKSYVLPSFNEVTTWYKFRTVDVLLQTDLLSNSEAVPPSELTIQNPSEFLMAQIGGNVLIDGVAVKVEDKSFPLLKSDKQYLLVMSKNKSGVAILAGGPTGVFTVNERGVIQPLVKKNHSFQTALISELGQSISDIKSRILLRRAEAH